MIINSFNIKILIKPEHIVKGNALPIKCNVYFIKEPSQLSLN